MITIRMTRNWEDLGEVFPRDEVLHLSEICQESSHDLWHLGIWDIAKDHTEVIEERERSL